MLTNGQPEAFIMDPLMFGANGTTSIKTLKNNYLSTPLIIFSSIPREEAGILCLTAGADIYIEKKAPLNEVFSIFSNALGVPEAPPNQKIKNDKSEGVIKFSKRQKQLLVLIDDGLGNDDIAKKLGINSRTQLIKFSRHNGYLCNFNLQKERVNYFNLPTFSSLFFNFAFI